MVYIINNILLLIISIVMVTSKPCDILENMSCECHSSLNNQTEQLACTNHHTPLNGSIKITNFTLQNPRTFDSFHLTFHARHFNISAMFINQLSYLFPRPSSSGRRQSMLKIILTFQDYLQLHFEDYSFYQLFGEKPEYTTSLSLELTSSGLISFSPMAFNQLIVDQLSLHSSSLEPYSFEEIFNQTKIGSLAVEGCTPRVNNTLRKYFNGKIRSGKFTKMVEMVSSEEFPNYPVGSMTIEAHEPRKLNASSFVSYYHLHGVHLIRPKFFFDSRSFDGFQYLPNLETIELDAETIKDNTFKPVLRTRFFTLGPNVRYLSEHSFDHLDYLTRFDLSKVILDQLYPSSKCILARHLQRQLKANPSMIIHPPQAEFCDCVYDFILNLINKKPEQSYTELCENTQQERCQLSECDVVKKFRFPSKEPTNSREVIPSIDASISDNPITFNSNPDRFPSYIPRHPPVYHGSNSNDESSGSSYAETQGLHASSFKANKPIDPNEISTDDDDVDINSQSAIHKSQLLTDNDEHQQLMIRNKRLKSIALSLLGITVISVLVVATIIWYFNRRASTTSTKTGFQRVPPVSSNV